MLWLEKTYLKRLSFIAETLQDKIDLKKVHILSCLCLGDVYWRNWTKWTVNSVQCILYSVQCTVYSVLCTVYSVQCKVYSEQCTVYSVHCTLYCVSVQCTVYSVKCKVYIVQYTVYSVQCIVYNVLCTVYSAQHLTGVVSDTWSASYRHGNISSYNTNK